MSVRTIDKVTGRYEISTGFIKGELKELVTDPVTSVIQFSTPLKETEIDFLEEFVFSQRQDILLRIYGHYNEECNLSYLGRVPSLKKFSADCLINAKGIETVVSLKNLEFLGVGIFNLENFDFLNDVNIDLKHLSLHQTYSKKPQINIISRFNQLEYLYLEGQSNGIESIKALENLQKVILRSVSTANLNYLSGLKQLWSVDIKLGGIKDFTALKTLPNLKYLEIWQVRKLTDISFITDLIPLQYLFLQSLPNIIALPELNKLINLRRVYLENLKGLKRLDSLKTAPALVDFIYALAQNQEPENLLSALENKSIRNVSCWFGSEKKNNHFKHLANSYGKNQFAYQNFVYQ